MSTRDELRDAQKRLREATKQRREGAANSDPQFLQLGLEEGERTAKEEVKGLQEKAAKENRAARDKRLQDARDLRNRRNQSSMQSAEFIGDVTARRLQSEAQAARANRQPTMPVSATYADDGSIDTTGLADNTILKRQDGTFGKFDIETGQITDVVFNPATDRFEVKNYTTPEGTALARNRLNAAMEMLQNVALQMGDEDAMAKFRELRNSYDAIIGDTALSQEQKDSAIAKLYTDNQESLDSMVDMQIQSVQEAKQAALEAQQREFGRLQYQADLKTQQAEADLLATATEAEEKLAKQHKTEDDNLDTQIQTEYDAAVAKYEAYLEAFKESETQGFLKVKEAKRKAGYPITGDEGYETPPIPPSRATFEQEFRMGRGLSRAAADAVSGERNIVRQATARMELLKTTILSAGRYQAFTKSMLDAGYSPGEVEHMYFALTLDAQTEMFYLGNVMGRSNERISRIRRDYSPVVEGSTVLIGQLRAMGVEPYEADGFTLTPQAQNLVSQARMAQAMRLNPQVARAILAAQARSKLDMDSGPQTFINYSTGEPVVVPPKPPQGDE